MWDSIAYKDKLKSFLEIKTWRSRANLNDHHYDGIYNSGQPIEPLVRILSDSLSSGTLSYQWISELMTWYSVGKCLLIIPRQSDDVIHVVTASRYCCCATVLIGLVLWSIWSWFETVKGWTGRPGNGGGLWRRPITWSANWKTKENVKPVVL